MHEVVDSRGFKRKVPIFEMIENFSELETDINEMFRLDEECQIKLNEVIEVIKDSNYKPNSTPVQTDSLSNPLSGISCSGEFWMMKDYTVTEDGNRYKIKGNVYDANTYALWKDRVGSDGSEGAINTIGDSSGLVKRDVTLYINKNIPVDIQKIEWFEIEKQTLYRFLHNNPHNTFLFKLGYDNNITQISDWYMNYSG